MWTVVPHCVLCSSSRLPDLGRYLGPTVIYIENVIAFLQKTQRAEGRGSWKLVPKDSCEVYKERRRKQLESQDKRSDESLSENSQKRKRRDKTRQKEMDKKVKKKPDRNTRNNRRR